jgi:hypothetical protein
MEPRLLLARGLLAVTETGRYPGEKCTLDRALN